MFICAQKSQIKDIDTVVPLSGSETQRYGWTSENGYRHLVANPILPDSTDVLRHQKKHFWRATSHEDLEIRRGDGWENGPFFRADSLLAEFKYPEALNEYMEIYDNSRNLMTSGAAMNGAIAAAQCDNDSLAITLVNYALEADTTFFDERISVTELLENCRLLPQWDCLQDESERRLALANPNYDIPLRNILLDIYHSDQNPRGHLIKLFKSDPENKEGQSKLWTEIQKTDSINLNKTIELLDRYGWIPCSKVGNANQALFFVIQHAAPNVIEKYISLFEEAAKDNEIPRDLYAKMYDRNQMYLGKPQRYGTQRVRKDPSTNEMILWKIEDPDKVNALRKEMNLPPLEEFPE